MHSERPAGCLSQFTFTCSSVKPVLKVATSVPPFAANADKRSNTSFGALYNAGTKITLYASRLVSSVQIISHSIFCS